MEDKDKFADEILTDEELEQVAGGTEDESNKDIFFLRDLGVIRIPCYHWGNNDIKRLHKFGWHKVGIDLKPVSYNVNNVYYLNHQEITRTQAIKHACEVMGKDLDDLPGGYGF